MFTSASNTGRSTETRTSAWAARWKIISGLRLAISSTSSGERTSSWWKEKSPSPRARGVGQVVEPSCRQVVDHVDLAALSQETVDEVGTDEPGTPGDHHPHCASPMSLLSVVE